MGFVRCWHCLLEETLASDFVFIVNFGQGAQLYRPARCEAHLHSVSLLGNLAFPEGSERQSAQSRGS